MASSYSTDLKLELQVTGENAGTWGDITNTNLVLLQQAIAGYQGVSIAGGAGTTALTMDNAALSNARNMVIEFTGAITGNRTVTIPDGIEKYYVLKNSTTGAFTVTFKYATTGTGITLTQNYLTICYADGTDIRTVDLTTLQGTIGTAQIASGAVTTAKISNNAITTALLDTAAVTSVKVASNAITTAALDTAAVTSVKIAAAAVGPTQLANTSVTAGSYTAASITVDAQGRLTAASSGSAGAGMGIPVLSAFGPASGTYTANPAANRIGAYIVGGGGGASQGGGSNYSGWGGWGFWNKPITQPFSAPYSVGTRGNAGPNTAPSGNPSFITNVGTANGGTVSSPGTAPGASYTVPFNTTSGDTANLSDGLRAQVVGIGFRNSPANYQAWGSGNLNGSFCGGAQGMPGVILIFENTGT